VANWQAQIGIVAGILSLFGYIPYIVSIFQQKTRPNRVSWWVWSVIGSVLVASYYSAGATHTLWVPLAQLLCQIPIALLSLKYGEGGKLHQLDKLCLAGAALSLLLWWRSGSPMVALAINIGMDILGAVPTLRKTYYVPASEDLLSWSIFWISNTLNLLALEHLSAPLLAYPLYLFSLGFILVALITRPFWLVWLISGLLLSRNVRFAPVSSKKRSAILQYHPTVAYRVKAVFKLYDDYNNSYLPMRPRFQFSNQRKLRTPLKSP
jgi:uncharacterized protein with PQ loop repeat